MLLSLRLLLLRTIYFFFFFFYYYFKPFFFLLLIIACQLLVLPLHVSIVCSCLHLLTLTKRKSITSVAFFFFLPFLHPRGKELFDHFCLLTFLCGSLLLTYVAVYVLLASVPSYLRFFFFFTLYISHYCSSTVFFCLWFFPCMWRFIFETWKGKTAAGGHLTKQLAAIYVLLFHYVCGKAPSPWVSASLHGLRREKTDYTCSE